MDYEKHNGSTAKSRARDQQRKQSSRSRPKKSGQKKDETRTREEKNREDNIEDNNNNVQSEDSEPTWSKQTGFERITDEDYAEWREAYPAVAIKQELAKANQWLLSNPAKSHKRLWRKFITNWLNAVQRSGGTRGYLPSKRPGEIEYKALN